MSETTHEKIKELSQILETDLKAWLRRPTTRAYFDMVVKDIARRKKLMADEIDLNNLDATELKIRTESNKAARSALDNMIDPASIINDFKHYDLLIPEEDSKDEV